MTKDKKTKYCQTCGIPLDIDYDNLGGGTNVEYCDYCLKHGVKGYDFSMDYLIYLWGLFPEEYYKEAGISYTSAEIREVMSNRLPRIKRWKQKINTAHVLYELIMRVQEYINRHLFDELILDSISQMVGISKYHFRRVFKAVCGENIGLYIQRLRLENIAFKLISTDISVTELVYRTNYQNKHTLSRAFKSYFGCTIPEFRRLHSNASPDGMNPVHITPLIKRIPLVRIAYLKLEWTEHITHDFTVLWEQVLSLSKSYNLQSNGGRFISLTLDCPLISSEEKARFLVGITIPTSFSVPKGFFTYEIDAGEYAIFHFKGLYHELNRVYRYIYLDWLPTSGYTLREPYTFETYLNTPEKTSVSELRTDIYVPVMRKKK